MPALARTLRTTPPTGSTVALTWAEDSGKPKVGTFVIHALASARKPIDFVIGFLTPPPTIPVPREVSKNVSKLPCSGSLAARWPPLLGRKIMAPPPKVTKGFHPDFISPNG